MRTWLYRYRAELLILAVWLSILGIGMGAAYATAAALSAFGGFHLGKHHERT